MELKILKLKSKSPINQREKYLAYFEPFEKLKDFSIRLGII